MQEKVNYSLEWVFDDKRLLQDVLVEMLLKRAESSWMDPSAGQPSADC